MTTITDLYRLLFGREGTNKGTDIDMAEHGRVGGVSTGQSFKHVSVIDPITGSSNQQVELINVFRSLLQAILYPGWLDRSSNQIRTTTVVTSATLAANQDIRTVTNLTNVGSFSGDILQRSANVTAWATNVRSLIT